MSLVRPITRLDIKGPAMYAHIRDDYRNRVIELKKPRRVLIGDIVELVFDNRLTLTMQIEEICRLENLTRDDQINDEIALTNQLMPSEDSLAATLFIALPQDDKLKERQSDLLYSEPDDSRRVVCPLRKGGVTFHHSKTPHMTNANESTEWRRILTQHLRAVGSEGEGDHYPWKVYVNQFTGQRTVPG